MMYPAYSHMVKKRYYTHTHTQREREIVRDNKANSLRLKIEESGCNWYCSYSCNFSISLKLFPNFKKFKGPLGYNPPLPPSR